MKSNLPGVCALLLLCWLPACTLFAPGNPDPDRSRPIVRIQTRKGVEFGAATSEGILFLNQHGAAGPCRVQFYLGPYPAVEDGTIEKFGGVYQEASIALQHAAADRRHVGRQLRRRLGRLRVRHLATGAREPVSLSDR